MIKTKRSNYGFTIVELLVVIIVIGILAAITIVSYSGIQNRAVATSLQSDLSNASDLLRVDQARGVGGIFPTSLVAVDAGHGVPASPGTTYVYQYNNTNTPKTFCLSATKSNQSYFITQEGVSFAGVCPVLYYDASIVTSYPGTGTTITDLSANGNNGTLMNGIPYSNVNDGVLVFDGVSDYINCGNNSTLNITNQITISAWLKWTTSAIKEILIKGNSTDNGIGPYEFFQNSNSVTFRTTKSGTSLDLTSATVISPNTWVNIVAVWDGVTKRIYINGIQDTNTQLQSSPLDITTGKLVVGAYGNGLYPFSGSIANIRVYNTALSADNISQNFTSLRSRFGI